MIRVFAKKKTLLIFETVICSICKSFYIKTYNIFYFFMAQNLNMIKKNDMRDMVKLSHILQLKFGTYMIIRMITIKSIIYLYFSVCLKKANKNNNI